MHSTISKSVNPMIFKLCRSTRVTLFFVGLAVYSAALYGADVLWSGGAGNGQFEDGGNWQGGGAPNNNDWQDIAVFGSTATPATVTLAANRLIKGLSFQTAGWTIDGSDFSKLKELESAGAGVNMLSGGFEVMSSSQPTWTLGAGNVLKLGWMYQNSVQITLAGGGTLEVGEDVNGWGTPKFEIQDATLRVLDSKVHQVSSGVTYLNEATSRVELQTTVSAAQALIGGAIVDTLGNGLLVNDIGGGFVEIVSATMMSPEPPIAGDWTLEFEDDFEGSTLDETKWKVGTHHSGIAGSAGTAPEMISVSGGVLQIQASTDDTTYSGTSYNYSAGEISTFQLFKQKYGYYEARIKYPAVTGLWPAFWLMPDMGAYGWTGNYYRSYIKFDLTGVNPGAISTAELKLKPTYVQSNGVPNVLVFGSEDDSWSESSITWDNKTGYNPVYLDQIYNDFTVGNDSVFGVADYVATQMSGDKVLTFMLADTYMRTREVRYGSREDSSQANRPRLVINGVTYYASEDASVRWSEPNTNFGSDTSLKVKDGWGNSSSTYNEGMEVDIMESLGIWGADKTQHALHWDGYGSDHQSDHSSKLSYNATSDGFHTYGLYWEEDRFEFYIDGVQSWQWEGERAMSTAAYLILSLQLGGWDYNHAGAQVEGQMMEVDYVRVWSGTKTPVTDPGGSGGGTVIFSQAEQLPYSSQDAGTGTVSSNGASVTLTGNVWKKFPYPYTITGNSILRFSVEASNVGEILAIGFDDNDIIDDAKHSIQIAGSQNWSGAYQVDPANVYIAGSGVQTYELAIGDLFTGTMTHLILIGDDDGNAQTNATFSDVEVFDIEQFDVANMLSYSTQDSGTATVANSGSSVTLSGNSWKKFPFAYTITANTVLRFTVNASDLGEILAIGLEDDDVIDSGKRVIQIGGSQDWSSNAFSLSGADVYTAGSGDVSYTIPLGSLLTGAMSHLCFVGDDDGDSSTQATFSNISLSEN